MRTFLKILALLLILLLLAGVGTYLFYFLEEKAATQKEAPRSQEKPILPLGGSGGAEGEDAGGTPAPAAQVFFLPTAVGQQIPVNDFRESYRVAKTPAQGSADGGAYILFVGKNAAGDTTYAALYFEYDGSFLISLFEEPLGTYRKEAEEELVALLGIPQEASCLLRYGVYVSKYANELLAGENLGFSFCAGAVALPVE